VALIAFVIGKSLGFLFVHALFAMDVAYCVPTNQTVPKSAPFTVWAFVPIPILSTPWTLLGLGAAFAGVATASHGLKTSPLYAYDM
jgi:hypothetical protein